MMINGKILFFNESEGKGIIINSQKEKIDFSIRDWDDFDIMPSLGLEVVFSTINDAALNIVSKVTYDNEDHSNEKITSQDINKDEVSKIDSNAISDFEINTEVMALEDQEDDDVEIQGIIEEVIEEIIDNKIKKTIESKEAFKELNELSTGNDKAEIIISPDEVTLEDKETDEASELEAQRDSITISLNISTAVSNYFEKIEGHINRRSAYKKVNGKLEYILIKRFLETTYNNLTDIDLHIITPKVKALHQDLKEMSSVYDDFINKTRYPHLAYKEVFLACQSEYMKIKNGADYTIEQLKKLQLNESTMGGVLKVKKEELNNNIKTAEFSALQNEMKSLDGAYVDVVHMMAEFDERYKNDMKLLSTFEEEYRADFYEKFGTEAILYKKYILDILDSQAYIFDAQLWQQAKKSRAVQAHFKESSIDGELNTKTYLKYYLDSLDSEKATGGTKKLFKLYDYLLSVQKDYIMIVVSSPQDAMEYEASIKNLKTTFATKAFIDEKSAIKWAMHNSVKILIVEDQLKSVNVEKFLHVYKKHTTLSPKIILLGQKPKINSYSINSLLSRNSSTKIITDCVKSILNSKK